MMDHSSNKRGTWINIIIFLLIVSALSVAPYYALVKLNPANIYIGVLMWVPAVAAFLTLKIRGGAISSMPWRGGELRFNLGAYVIPILYISIAYILAWLLGSYDIINTATIEEWSRELGLDSGAVAVVMIVMVLLLATIGFITAGVTVLGEEIGWRGFLIWELRKLFPFGAVAIISGLIWSFWHWPIVLYYGGGSFPFQMATFTVTLVSMSIIMTYFTFKSSSIWPAVIFHSAHNTFIQQILTPISITTDQRNFWIDEFGMMIPMVAALFALFFWRTAKKEGL